MSTESGNTPVIGIDLDNTIVQYDNLIYQLALAKNFISHNTIVSKNVVRDTIRCIPDGEYKWQALQAQIYGPLMTFATPMKGITKFLRQCVTSKIKVYIISHKTQYASSDKQVDLRMAAINWLIQYHIIDNAETPITHSDVYFENSQTEKIERISSVGCTHYVDDLYDVLNHKAFPSIVDKIWLSQETKQKNKTSIQELCSWAEISEHIFSSDLQKASTRILTSIAAN